MVNLMSKCIQNSDYNYDQENMHLDKGWKSMVYWKVWSVKAVGLSKFFLSENLEFQ